MNDPLRWTAAAAVALTLAPASVHAASAASRVWVSGHGVDQAGCGAPTDPCRSLQYAHDHAVAAGGEIDILDPAGYGPITITKAISIVNDGVGTAGVQATSGNAISINAGPNDAVFLKGLSVDGVHGSAVNGILLTTAGSLTIVNCVVRHVQQKGIAIAPTSGTLRVLIKDTMASDDEYGIFSQPQGATANVTGVIEHVTADDNSFEGIHLAGGAASAAFSTFAINDTSASMNNDAGIEIATAGNVTSSANIDSSYFDNNGVGSGNGEGLEVGGVVVVRVSRSLIDANTETGVFNGVFAPGAVYSAGDNHIDGNLKFNTQGAALFPDGSE